MSLAAPFYLSLSFWIKALLDRFRKVLVLIAFFLDLTILRPKSHMGTMSNGHLDAEVMMKSGDTEGTRNKADNSYIQKGLSKALIGAKANRMLRRMYDCCARRFACCLCSVVGVVTFVAIY